MGYQIVLSNGTILLNLGENVLDNTTSLTLVGKNYVGYGTAITDNFVHLLENSANSSAPSNPLVGQLWWDTTNSLMKVWTGTLWFSLAIGVASVVGQTGTVTLAQLVANGIAPLVSPSLTGIPQVPTATLGTSTNQIASTAFVQAAIGTLHTGVTSVAGLTGVIILSQLVTAGVAPLSSPNFLNVPTAPTAAPGTNTTQLASTAFVTAAVSASTSGVVSVLGNTGVVTLAQMTAGGLAGINSPNFAGTPQAPTATLGANTTQIASTQFVTRAIGNSVTAFNTRTGAVVLTGADVSTALTYSPVAQGIGIGQLGNSVRIGWSSASRLKATVDTTDLGNFVFEGSFGSGFGHYVAFGAGTSSFVAPCVRVLVTVVGGGGPGTGCFTGAPGDTFSSGGGGGAGGMAIAVLSLTIGQSYTVIVGAAGVVNATPTNPGTAGGTSSFAPAGGAVLLSATGGQPGSWNTTVSSNGGGGGTGFNGLFIFNGADGSDGQNGAFTTGGNGASGPWGGGGRAGAGAGFSGHAAGAGGGGVYSAAGTPGNGAAGLVIVQY